MTIITDGEDAYCSVIQQKDSSLRLFLKDNVLSRPPDPRSWFDYMIQVKDILGNVSNSVSFLATLMAKEYLVERFRVEHFDAAAKAQGAPGHDIDAIAADGKAIHCEIKTTRPYQPGFGAQQKKKMLEDLTKLSLSSADYRLMMVTDGDSYAALCHSRYAKHCRSIEIVNLLTKETFLQNDGR